MFLFNNCFVFIRVYFLTLGFIKGIYLNDIKSLNLYDMLLKLYLLFNIYFFFFFSRKICLIILVKLKILCFVFLFK